MGLRAAALRGLPRGGVAREGARRPSTSLVAELAAAANGAVVSDNGPWSSPWETLCLHAWVATKRRDSWLVNEQRDGA